ncbi:myeloid cell surface antigen CD33-like [Elephas maximus indicus]|uniref:myeloid cell surface antigen CD33-like n=1 Tax=Elephas maximus indicus TaxID=99487 RepID=UPI0021163FC1|nr:myeloid cell surface antigen CD33-like [Elephas maximus indicus]
MWYEVLLLWLVTFLTSSLSFLLGLLHSPLTPGPCAPNSKDAAAAVALAVGRAGLTLFMATGSRMRTIMSPMLQQPLMTQLEKCGRRPRTDSTSLETHRIITVPWISEMPGWWTQDHMSLSPDTDIHIQGILKSGHPTNITCKVPWACKRGTPLTFSWIGVALKTLGSKTPHSSELTLTPEPRHRGTNLTC